VSTQSKAPAPEPLLCVRLYIAGEGPNSVAAIANLRLALARCDEHLVEVETIDVLRDPARALRDGVLVTPMLVRVAPVPERRILGNLRDRDTLLGVLGIEGVLRE
jgi:circadian clock protein KaiB